MMAVLTAALMAAAPAAFDTSGWTWQVPVELREAPPGFVRLLLHPEILDASRPSLSDLRLLDETGRLTPYVIDRDPPNPDLTPVPITSITTRYDEDDKLSVHEIDLGFRNLPLTTIFLDVADPYFHRDFDLLGRNPVNDSADDDAGPGLPIIGRKSYWQPVLSGVFRRSRDDGKTTDCVSVDRLDKSYRYLQIRIHDADNPPLTINEIRVFRHEIGLVFDLPAERSLTLIGGNPEAEAPTFDLARSVRGVAERDLPTVALGTLAPLDTEPEPWKPGRNVLVWTALIAGVAVMLVLIATNLSKLR